MWIDGEDATFPYSGYRDALTANLEDAALTERKLRDTAEVDYKTAECSCSGHVCNLQESPKKKPTSVGR